MEDAPGCKINFTIRGTPVPKARPRAAVVGTDEDRHAVIYTPKNTAQFELYVKQIANENAPPKLLSGPLEMTLDFYLQRPQSLPVNVNYMTKRPDADNLAKSVMDALEGVIYEHDAQVVVLHIVKQYGTPGVDIKIVEMPTK